MKQNAPQVYVNIFWIIISPMPQGRMCTAQPPGVYSFTGFHICGPCFRPDDATTLRVWPMWNGQANAGVYTTDHKRSWYLRWTICVQRTYRGYAEPTWAWPNLIGPCFFPSFLLFSHFLAAVFSAFFIDMWNAKRDRMFIKWQPPKGENDDYRKGKMMIMIIKTCGSQVDSPVAEGKRKEGGGRKIRDLHRDT